jgi:hypothetical protein
MNSTQLRDLLSRGSVGAFHGLAEQTQLPLVFNQFHEPIVVMNLGSIAPVNSVWRTSGVVAITETPVNSDGVQGTLIQARILVKSHGPVALYSENLGNSQRYNCAPIPYRTTQTLFLRDLTFTIESLGPVAAGFRRIVAKARKAETTSAVGRR